MPKITEPLTKAEVEKATPTEKAYKLYDGKGLFLLVTSKGSKLWRISYWYQGKQKQLSLGQYPDVSLEQARKKCMEIRKLKSTGIDPSEHRKEQRQARKGNDDSEKEKRQIKEELDKLHNMTVSELLQQKISIKTLAGIVANLSDEDILKAKRIIESLRKLPA